MKEDDFYQEYSSKGILLHVAKEWWEVCMTGTSSPVSLTDQAMPAEYTREQTEEQEEKAKDVDACWSEPQHAAQRQQAPVPVIVTSNSHSNIHQPY